MIGTKIILEDNSVIPQISIDDVANRVIIMTAFTSDKGTEKWIKISGNNFFNMYGTPSFKTHGQPLLQAANAINSGAVLYAKRVVDPTSKLAMFGIVGNLTKTEKTYQTIKTNPLTGQNVIGPDGAVVMQDMYWTAADVAAIKDENARPRYTQDKAGDSPVKATYKCAQINYTLETIDDTFGGNAKAMAKKFLNQYKGDNAFPLFIVTDNGRGVSNKRVIISSDTTLGRSAESARYTLDVYEGYSRLESMVFSMNPDEVSGGYNIFFDNVVKRASSQLQCFGFEDSVEAFYNKIAELSGIDKDEIKKYDIFNGCDYRGNTVPNIEIKTATNDGSSTVQLTTINGISLIGGYNGDTFKDNPIAVRNAIQVGKENENVYATQFKEAFDGTFDDEIFNYDNTPIDVIIDANYPDIVKKAIANFIAFRQDVFYFRDIGLGYDNHTAIKNRLQDFDDNIQKTYFAATYCQDYNTIDPYTKKSINVTLGYPIASNIVGHWANGRHNVLAGITNGWVVDDMIEGTLNYSPKNTPAEDQKAELDDLRVNYGYYQNDEFVFASEYTSQERYTQLSYINNMLLVQELIKDIRTQCPKSRYKFITGDDFTAYEQDIQKVIDQYNSKFAGIKLSWVQDAIYAANKIVYATIKVKFKDFDQEEIFRIIAIPVTDTL